MPQNIENPEEKKVTTGTTEEKSLQMGARYDLQTLRVHLATPPSTPGTGGFVITLWGGSPSRGASLMPKQEATLFYVLLQQFPTISL